MAKTVTVVIVSWNGRDYLSPCLEALATQTYPDLEVIVVDNASIDGSPELVRDAYPHVRLIQNRANLGFAAANNVAIRASDTPYVATLNNDTIVDPGWLRSLVERAESETGVGSVASKMVFAHAPEVMNSGGIALDPVGIAWDRWGGFPAQLLDEPREVFGACAGAALYRREMLDDVGLFAERFFAYLEDVDLAWRARLRRWRCLYAPDAVVRHVHSGTLGEGSPRKRYLLARNKVWTIARCAPSEDLQERLPEIALYDVGAATFGVLRQHDLASVQGRLAGITGLPAVWAERREIQARRTASLEEVRRWYAPLAAPTDVPRRYWHLTGHWPNLPMAHSPQRLETTQDRTRRTSSPVTEPESHVTRGSRVATNRRWTTREPRPAVRRAGLALAGRLLPARQRADSPSKGRPAPRVVVLRPDHLGDALLSRPAIELLRDSLGRQAVTVVAGPWGAPSLQRLEVRVATFPFAGFTRREKRSALAPYGELLALAGRLRRERFDAALVLRPDHWWGALATALAGIPIRVGHAAPEVAPLLTRAVELRPTEHTSAAALRAARALLLELDMPPVGEADRPVRFAPSLPGEEEARVALRQVFNRETDFVVVHPGAGAALKSWPASRWAALVRKLSRGHMVLLTGGPAERSSLTDIQRQVGGATPCLTELSWDGLAALYRRAELVIGQDSGPLHLAAAVGTPTVRWYGPTDPGIFGPAGDLDMHRVLASTLPCAPCGNLEDPPCGYRQDPPCLAQITLQAALHHISAVHRAPAAP